MGTIVFRHNDSGKELLRLSGDSLHDISLSGVDLSGAAMYAIEQTDPPKGYGRNVALKLQRVDLSGADCSNATMVGAVFSEETLVAVDFRNADLRDAVFVRTHFVRCNFDGADLTGARLMSTCFSNCRALHRAKGLDALEHVGPSSLDARTLRMSVAHMPTTVLLAMGYTEREITTLRGLYERERAFYSCFISYARADHAFASQLRKRLLKKNISCWQDVFDMKGGSQWRGQIYDAIEKHDKLILVCSRESVARPAVVEELLEAIDRERATRTQKLFPVRLDDYVLSGELETLARDKVATGEWRENWIQYVRAYHIPDFTNWQKPKVFTREFDKLVEALKKPEKR
jgi:hypothetical protein